MDDYLDGVAQDILDALRAAQDAEDKAQQAIEDAEANVATINTEVGKYRRSWTERYRTGFMPILLHSQITLQATGLRETY